MLNKFKITFEIQILTNQLFINGYVLNKHNFHYNC